MSHSQNGRSSLKTALKATTVGGLAALMLSTGIAAPILHSFAAPVEVTAPQVPSFANVVDAVSPAVVSVRVQSNVQPASDDSSNFSFNFGGRGLDQFPDDHPLKRFFKEFGGPNQDRSDRGPNRHRDGKGPLRPVAQGSGFFISEDGYIVTNNHVVDGGQLVQVTLSDGSTYSAEIVGTDASTDLAVLRLQDPPGDLQPATFGDSTAVTVGEGVMAIGTPLGLQNTVTTGIVSATARPVTTTGQQPDGSDSAYTSAIQTDAAINPGNSGGPLVDATGAVIGINSSIAGLPSSQETSGSIGLGFAIPSSTAKLIADQLIESGSAQHAYLGVTTKDGTAQADGTARAGAEVVSTEQGTPAAKGGLKEGDVVVAVDDTSVDSAAALTGVVRGLEIGSEHTLTVIRDGAEQQVTVTPTAAP